MDGKISYANVNVEGNVPACKVSASFFANVNEDRQCSFMGQRNAHHRKNDLDSLMMFTRYADGLSNLVINHLSNALSDQAARRLAEQLNQTETHYPGTNLRLCFKMVSDLFPGNQEI